MCMMGVGRDFVYECEQKYLHMYICTRMHMYRMSMRWDFFIMCGYVRIGSNENTGDTNLLNYTEPYKIYGRMRGLFSCSRVRCT